MPDQCLSVPLSASQDWSKVDNGIPVQKKSFCAVQTPTRTTAIPFQNVAVYYTTRTVYTPSCDKRPVTTI